ncbi:chitin synthesis regulation, resistance to congo red-domain-containing protein [Hypoxylon rubiginosum]|uniref:Chitin synthesis regulation, resistance to congo red-domain-containing protein n=1 Tax=Hypoxylon rubiginosum TaxID=110542 RepID=A0ACC0DNG3_9PEZI|nr:chitin synthesis regulation, resistance to congo red-domain-containing protein [Hypoxylon rubiginosum]
MAPLIEIAAQLSKRRYNCDDYEYNRYGQCYSAWNWYGRWIFAGVVIFLVLVLFFLWACINSRRRRRNGLQPMYGTGWMANNQGGNPHYNNAQGYNNPPPAYGAPQGQSYPMQNQYTGTTFSRNDGYYGQEGVQAPKNVYNNHGKDDYAPPEGPPPAR